MIIAALRAAHLIVAQEQVELMSRIDRQANKQFQRIVTGNQFSTRTIPTSNRSAVYNCNCLMYFQLITRCFAPGSDIKKMLNAPLKPKLLFDQVPVTSTYHTPD